MLIDALNYDDLVRLQDEGGAMDDKQKMIWAELVEKSHARPELLKHRDWK
ncbi:MAG: hypothetical protein JWO38_2293 [Gemmataceae bacterium]|nr:hypothetical protein [Gemmataceae bacterium]